MPRPDLLLLGIKHRRIPVLSIGRDVYLDTRLILEKLEGLPHNGGAAFRPKLGASDPQDRGVERLLATLTLDTGLFLSAARLLPKELTLLQDPKFVRDREDFFPKSDTSPPSAPHNMSKVRNQGGDAVRGGNGPEPKEDAVNRIRAGMELIETTLLADGRDWILKTDQPSLADIEAIWPFYWLVTLPAPALPADQVSAEQFPRVYAWISRFDEAVRAAKREAPKPKTLSGEEAAALILGSPFYEPEDGAVAAAPWGLQKGQVVQLWPTDTGVAHKDVGTLVALDGRESVIEVDGTKGCIRLHAPRHGFRIRAHADL